MATIASPSPSPWPKRRARAWAIRCERYFCLLGTYFPLAFVYSLTTWAVYVEAGLGFKSSRSNWIGIPSSIVGVALYLILNACYSVAVFTDPGSPSMVNTRGKGGRQHQYSVLPVTEPAEYTAFTIFSDWAPSDAGLPVSVVILSLLGGVIGLVLTGFTAWHISLAVRGMTTIESLEKTRYVSPLRMAFNGRRFGGQNGQSLGDTFGQRLQDYGNQILEAHANAIPGVTRAEEGEERASPTPEPRPVPLPSDDADLAHHNTNNFTPAQQSLFRSYADFERRREQDRYQDYLDEKDSDKMPCAFDLGWRRNLIHLFGDRPLLWFIPVHTTSGDGWHWEPSKKFLEAREQLRVERERELARERQYYQDLYRRNMNNSRAWLGDAAPRTPSLGIPNRHSFNDSERPGTGVSMKTLAPMSPRSSREDTESEEENNFDENNLLLNRGSKVPASSDNRNEASKLKRTKGHREETDEWSHWD
ncbi:palmitoyltransferase for Vac8p [Monascus purpureus]|uniref:Palmitoyltransferase for Vac8p n=1 Tax=Monascus purpureus TaxID=5098 RepID=A0A507QR73_MONPU|nr:palmitoyltransferase for Vac8p [Monascus purpureus]